MSSSTFADRLASWTPTLKRLADPRRRAAAAAGDRTALGEIFPLLDKLRALGTAEGLTAEAIEERIATAIEGRADT